MMQETSIDLPAIEYELSETGQFALPDWLVNSGQLPYSAYEAWRNGEGATFDEALGWPQAALEALLAHTERGCAHLKLVPEAAEYFAWQGGAKALLLSRNSALAQALAKVWKRPEDLPQLDLFLDNSAVVGENKVQMLLAARQFGAAQTALDKLAAINPSHPKLGHYQDLVNYGLHIEAQPVVAVADFAEEHAGFMAEVAPLARETLKAQSRDYLAFGWRRLATNAQGLSFAAQHWQWHPAYALAQVPDWQAVRELLSADPHTYRHPELLCLLAQAYFASAAEVQLGYLVWGQLAERFPDFVEAQIGRHELARKHLALTETWDRFCAFDEHWPTQWFLGFWLLEKPGLVHLLERLPAGDAQAVSNPVNRTVAELVRAKIEDHDQKLLRAQLKSQAPALLRCFMNKRDWLRSV